MPNGHYGFCTNWIRRGIVLGTVCRNNRWLSAKGGLQTFRKGEILNMDIINIEAVMRILPERERGGEV